MSPNGEVFHLPRPNVVDCPDDFDIESTSLGFVCLFLTGFFNTVLLW
jgi:hypothetical protein